MAFVFEEKRFKSEKEKIPGPGDYDPNTNNSILTKAKSIPFNTSEARFQNLSTSIEIPSSIIKKEINSQKLEYIPESAAFKSQSKRFKTEIGSPGPGEYFGKGKNQHWSDQVIKKIEHEKILKEMFDQVNPKTKKRKNIKFSKNNNENIKLKTSLSSPNFNHSLFNNSSIISTRNFENFDEILEEKYKSQSELRPLAQGKVTGVKPSSKINFKSQLNLRKKIKGIKWQKPNKTKKHFMINQESLGPGLYDFHEELIPFFQMQNLSSIKSKTNRNMKEIK